MKPRNKIILIGASIATLLFLIVAFTTIGSVNISLSDIISNIKNNDDKMISTIVYQMRLPRNILAVLVGMNLAISGLLLQAVMKNPLADPGLTGVSTGASVAAIIVLLLAPQYINILPLLAFIGGAIACAMVYILAWKGGLSPTRVVLAGVAINSMLGGVISLLTIIYSDRIQSALLWLNGSLSGKTWADVRLVAMYSIIGLTAAMFCARSANVLNLGDDSAKNLGFNVNRTRLLLSAVAVFLAASSTAIVGVISFIGLIVPHMSRMIIGSDHKYTLPFSMALGGIVLLVADTIGRTAAGAVELPVGVVMSIVGGPFFLYLLRKKGGA